MVESRTINAVQAVILAGLVGQTWTGTNITVALSESDDDVDPTIAARECADGGVVVLADGGSGGEYSHNQSSGGMQQRTWSHRFLVRVSVKVAGTSGQMLSDDVTSFIRQGVNMIEAALEPTSGTRSVVSGVTYSRPRRMPPPSSDFYMFEFTATVREPWAR